MSSKSDALKSVRLFAEIDPKHIADIAERMQPLRADAGQEIFKRGDEGDRLYVVRSGEVRIGMSSPMGKEVTLAVLGPGDAFGELSLLDAGPRSADAVATSASELLLLSRHEFAGLLERNPEIYPGLMRSLAGMVRGADEKLAEVAFLDVHARMARTFGDLMVRHRIETPDGIVIDRDLTALDLAALSGLYEAEVERLLRDYQYEDIIRVDGARFTVRRPEVLDSFLSFAAG